MYIYEIIGKRIIRDTPLVVEVLATGCYSGFERGKDNPALQSERGVGPIPTGAYWIGEARDTPDHGPVVMPLVPVPGVDIYGRSGFLLHGDSREHPGEASHGCIILPRPIRERIAANSDRLLLVITGGA